MAGGPPVSDNIYILGLPPNFDEEQCRTIFGAYGAVTSCRVLAPKRPDQETCAALVRYQSVDQAKWIVDNLNGNIPQGLQSVVQVKFAANSGGAAKGGYGDWGKGGGKGGMMGDQRFSPYPDPYGKGAPYGGGGKGDAFGFDPYGGKGKGKSGASIRSIVEGLYKSGAMPGSGIQNDAAAVYVAGLPPDTTDMDLYKIFAPFGAIAPRGVRAMQADDGSCKGVAFVNFLEPAQANIACMTLNGCVLPDSSILKVAIKSGGKKGIDQPAPQAWAQAAPEASWPTETQSQDDQFVAMPPPPAIQS